MIFWSENFYPKIKRPKFYRPKFLGINVVGMASKNAPAFVHPITMHVYNFLIASKNQRQGIDSNYGNNISFFRLFVEEFLHEAMGASLEHIWPVPSILLNSYNITAHI